MRTLRLTKSGHNKLKSYQRELKVQDLEDSIKSLPPGEWCFLVAPGSDDAYVATVNPLINEKFPCVQILKSGSTKDLQDFSPETLIEEKLTSAFERRQRFKGYETGARLFYGTVDGLTGLIIDGFANACVIQINTAGIDRYRELIRTKMSALTGVKAYFLDNPKYREKEFLPTFEVEPLPALTVKENGLTYELSAEVIQKVGFYYDHRENRAQLASLLSRLKKVPERGVDLFCYAGSWGLNAMKAGVKTMDFVDQGNFDEVIRGALTTNRLGEGRFHRSDVFKFLDDAVASGRRYDLVICDPPAFAKSPLQKSQALDGYSKLHRKVFRAAAPGAICALSSCTHYIDHDEFQKNVLDAAHREGKKIQLLYCGMQGWDHPVEFLGDRGNYIKSYFFIME